MLNISILPETQEGCPVCEIIIGDHVETFPLQVNFWSAEEYTRQWHDAINRIVSGGVEIVAALIVDIQPPGESIGLTWWPIYRSGDRIYIRQQLLFFNSLAKPFDIQNPYESVRPRVEDPQISEWELPLNCLKKYRRNGV